MRVSHFAVFVAILASWAHLASASAIEAPKVPANTMAEISFTATADLKDPFNDITLDVIFTDPAGVQRRVPAFWAGGRVWEVRYASPLGGTHHFRSVCSQPIAGLQGVEGTVEVIPYTGDNPLFVHGPLRVAAGGRYLEHADGTPFLWLGDTWWMGLTKRLAWPEEFQKLTADRRAKGFNVVQIVAGLYPDMPAFDERGANAAGFPWEKDYARIRPEYFDAADRKIMYLVDQGIVPCIVGAWGYQLPWLGQEKMRQHQRYVYARWGALPIVWCVAGELNLPYYKSPDFPKKGQMQTAEWEKVLTYARSINAFGRLITSHPTGIPPRSMRGVLKDSSLIDFDMLQTPHGQMEAIGPTVEAVKFSTSATPSMPTVNAEPSYEMLFDRTPAEVVRRVFWVCWAGGVKGYTYGANGIWQLNRRDQPYGRSASGADYGKITWDDAMNLPGSTQVSLGKKLMSEYHWEHFEPHPSWASWAEPAAPPLTPALGDWIWFPEGEPAVDAPVGVRTFRRTFELPADVKVIRAALAITADDKCTVWLNGVELGSQNDWHTVRQFEIPAQKLRHGRNVLAVRAENVKADVPKNPAGLIAGLLVELEGGGRVAVATDAQWQASNDPPAGWQMPDFDAPWPKAKIAAPRGGGPWGKIAARAGANPYDVPYAFGIAGEVRFVYVPDSRAVLLKDLEPGSKSVGIYFDPATGERTPIAPLAADTNGTRRVDPPPAGRGGAHDWVLVVEMLK